MVETSLFPRPHFTSFLQSNDSVDPLSYYEYQRLQRQQKAARLQERRSKSYEPGYKKPTQTQPSRLIFTKPGLRYGGNTVTREFSQSQSAESIPDAKQPDEKPVSAITMGPVRPGEGGGGDKGKEETSYKQSQSQHLPREFSRPVKSATVQGMQRSLSSKTLLPQRPKTASIVGTRDVGTSTAPAAVSFQVPGKRRGEKKNTEPVEDGTKVVDLDGDVMDHTEEGHQSLVADRLKETMAKAYHWTTSAQRAHHEVDWADRVPPPIPPPTSTIEHLPDPVSQKVTFRRYNSCPEPWQVYGSEWDYMQSRFGDYQFQEPVNFCAASRHSQYIPGYTGCVPGSGGEVDHPFLSRLLVRRLTPRHTRISRKANIPGYTGHGHWTRVDPAHSDLVLPNPLTSARTHRELPLEEDLSPFRRTSPMSKTITLVSPYNPFNKIEY